jgi:hypothetical protein
MSISNYVPQHLRFNEEKLYEFLNRKKGFYLKPNIETLVDDILAYRYHTHKSKDDKLCDLMKDIYVFSFSYITTNEIPHYENPTELKIENVDWDNVKMDLFKGVSKLYTGEGAEEILKAFGYELISAYHFKQFNSINPLK